MGLCGSEQQAQAGDTRPGRAFHEREQKPWHFPPNRQRWVKKALHQDIRECYQGAIQARGRHSYTETVEIKQELEAGFQQIRYSRSGTAFPGEMLIEGSALAFPQGFIP